MKQKQTTQTPVELNEMPELNSKPKDLSKTVVKMKYDDSVQKLIQQKAKTLTKKYAKTRKINERLARKRKPWEKALVIIGDIFCGILILIAGVFCFSGINSRLQNICPTFAGYANLTVTSGSMVKSGFNIGDTVIVKTVDTKTLHEGDMIAFYVYPKSYKSYDISTSIRINDDEIAAHKYTTSFASIFGRQSTDIVEAAKANSNLVFHHIREIYQDPSGMRWFKTYGSSNDADDIWFIAENMVVGLYVNNDTAHFFASIISAVNSGGGFLILLVPVLTLASMLVWESLKNVERAKLELDCVEEKRKITDPICVKNKIGFGMDTKTKYKILAQANPENYNEYLKLLWKGEAPVAVHKHLIKRNLLLEYNTQLLALNRECEKMFKDGVNAEKVAEYYVLRKTVLQKEQLNKDRELEERQDKKA